MRNSTDTITGLTSKAVTADSYECSITVDCVIFGFQEKTLKILLAKRSLEPYKDYWLIPGGIMEENQTLNEAVDDVLLNLTGIRDLHYEQVGTYSSIDRHPVKRVLTVAYYALIKPENHPANAKDPLSELKWFPVEKMPAPLGFDHDQVVQDAINKLKHDVSEKLLFGELLPTRFTLKELQDLYESILGEKQDRRNFRKKILSMNILKNTNEKKVGQKGGPELYLFKT